MSGPSFVSQPDPALPLYFMNPAPPPGLPGYQVGYWVTSNKPWPELPLTLADSWSKVKGVYLLLNATPADLEAFAAQLVELLNSPSFVNARFLWLANPDAPLQQWTVQALAASQPEGVVDPPADLTFRNYRLGIGQGSGVALAASQDGFSITPPGEFPEAIAFSVIGGARYPLTGGGGAPNLPMTGPTIGCLAFSLTTDQTDFFAAVDSGVRYFMKDPVLPRFKRVKSLPYPVFAGAPGQTLATVLDPSNPLSYERSFLGFPPAGSPIASRFTTNYGNPLTLAPTFSTFAPCGPRLAFAARPRRQDGDPEADYYLAPAGSFTVATTVNEAAPSAAGGFTPPATRVMCGAAGVEYLGLTSPTGSLLHFFPNQPAYAPSLGDAPPDVEAAARALAPRANDDPLLTDYASTSWLYATPPAASSVVYFAQPNDAALYGATASQYLQFLEVPAGTFQTGGLAAAGSLTPAFPMVPYTGVEAATVTDYADMETKILSPLRRDLVSRLTTGAPPPTAAALLAAPPVSGATPQGLLVELDDSRTQWLTLTLAKLADDALRLHDVRGGFKEALQTNQLFAVLSDPSVVLSAAGLEYEITEVVIRDLASKVDPVPKPVLDKLRPMLGTVYPDDPAFQTALKAALTTDYDQYGAVVTRYAAKFDLEIEGWRFRLSPTMWTANPAAQTICLFKYANRPLQALAEDVSAWSWLPAAGNAAETQARLLKILNDAAAVVDASGGVPNDLDYFVKVVMRNPAWNGILFLNANVPLSTLPPDLSGLVSGIEPERFYGHHFGVEITPIEPGQTLGLASSSLFGLILYDDPEDLVFNGALYDFKVLLLKVLFSNSTITGFASRIELMTNAYFGDRGNLAASEHGNNLILDGSRQLQGETATYVYLQEGSNVFVMRSTVLREVEITKTQFVTLVPASGSVTDVSSASRFLLWGRIRFDALPGFDVFSFGPTLSPDNVVVKDGFLPFANLSVDMASDGTAGGTKTFAFNPNDITFDSASAETRADSLYAHFPLVVTGLLRGRRGTTLGDLGYVPVKTPLNAGPLADDWYALTFQLDLGTLGALAGQLGFVVSLAAAWSPAENTTNAMVALRLPGGRSLTSVIPIQGVIKLGFNSIDFTASPAGAGVSYQLLFRKFALQLLSFSFPPGQADLSFFGNPNNTDRSSIGWYAAYLKGK